MVSVTDPAATMTPPTALLTDVLPSERLGPTGVARPELRSELREIPQLLNALHVAGVWAQAVAVIALAARLGHPVGWVAAFLLMGRVHTMLGVLSHEAAHRLLFRNRPTNDAVGRWVLSYPTFISFDGYRRGHFAHHRDEMGPDEPDLRLYAGYPVPLRTLARRLRRDALGVSGFKILRGLASGVRRSRRARSRAVRIYGTQVLIAAGFAAFGRPELYVLLWLAPWLTMTRVTNRLRALAEHGGMTRSSDRRLTTHHVRQSWLGRFWLAPFHTGWHLAHHVDMGVPWRNLPRMHAELVAAGYVTDDLTYPTYRALWRRLASG